MIPPVPCRVISVPRNGCVIGGALILAAAFIECKSASPLPWRCWLRAVFGQVVEPNRGYSNYSPIDCIANLRGD